MRACERSLRKSTPDHLERGSWTSLSVLTLDMVPCRVICACSPHQCALCVCVQEYACAAHMQA